MKKRIAVLMTLIIVLAFGVGTVLADLPTEGNIEEIEPLDSVVRGENESDGKIFLFQEQEAMELTQGVYVNITEDGTYDKNSDEIGTATISKGTWVESYFLHMDPVGEPSTSKCLKGSVTFDEDILGLVVFNSELEGSDGLLGHPDTIYPAQGSDAGRRVELPGELSSDDVVVLEGNTLTVTLCVHNEWSDQVRVLTQGTVDVEIDIKPGSYPNSFNVNGKGVIPVAILGSPDFDVTEIDTSTLSFGGLDLRVKGNGAPQCSIEDVSGANMPDGEPDGYPDLVCQFEDDASNWEEGEAGATLTGRLTNGAPFKGTDSINIVP